MTTLSRFAGLFGLLGLSLTSALSAAEPGTKAEPEHTGWAFYMDNDLFVPGHRDRDYTGGFSLTRSGSALRDNAFSMEPVRAWVDALVGADHFYREKLDSGDTSTNSGNASTRHSQEFGITTFTPADLSSVSAQQGDRPYASLVYMSQSRAHIDHQSDTAYLSTLTLGILGLDVIGDLQIDLHKSLSSTEPKGWENQISAGGEPTFRYSVARTQRIAKSEFAGGSSETSVALRASVGYLTQLTFGLATRLGEIQSPWWSYNPQLADYAEKTVPVAAIEGSNERYFWAGFSLHLRAYNAFLQGQFRDSAVTFGASELEPLVGEAWMGYTIACTSGWRYSYVVRAMSSEIKNGPGDRSVAWGGLTISQAF